MTTHVREKPPLRHIIDVETPTGRHYRWALDEPNPSNVFQNPRYSDSIPGGHENAECVLPRDPHVDYADVERLSDMRIQGPGGESYWEGRLERAPRSSGDQIAISPAAVGNVAYLDDNKNALLLAVDRDVTHWQDATLLRRAQLAAGLAPQGKIQLSVAQGGIVWDYPVESLPDEEVSEVMYIAPASVRAAKLGYSLVHPNAPAGVEASALFSDDNEAMSSPASVSLNADGTLREVAIATPERYLMMRCRIATGPSTPVAGAQKRASKLAVYSDHGLTLRAIDGEPSGVLASDVVRHAVETWAPHLNVHNDSIQQSSFVIPHLAFLEPTTASEIVRGASRFELPDWAVWDGKEFVWHASGARGRTWRLRVGPSQLEETGESVERLWESIVVQYQDADGGTRTVGPPGSGADTESADLKDDDPDNPANKKGITRRDRLVMGVTTAAGATEVGKRFLEQTKLLDRSGKARVVGWAEDDRGVIHPFSAIRSGDMAVVVDAADTSARKIVHTDKDFSTRTCNIDLDAPPAGLQATLERLQAVLVRAGLT